MLQKEGPLILGTRCALPFNVYQNGGPKAEHEKKLTTKNDPISNNLGIHKSSSEHDLTRNSICILLNKDISESLNDVSQEDTAKQDSESQPSPPKSRLLKLSKSEGVKKHRGLDNRKPSRYSSEPDINRILPKVSRVLPQPPPLLVINNCVEEGRECAENEGSSSSDELEEGGPVESEILKYTSDSDRLGLDKSYTGKLAVCVLTVYGMTSTNPKNTYYCTLDTDREYKAKTKCRLINSSNVLFDDEFDIDIQKEKALIIRLYKQRSIFADKHICTSRVTLQSILQTDKTAKLLLSDSKGAIHTRVNIRFTDASKLLKRRMSSRKSGVFGFDLAKTLATEKNTIPILVRKCVAEIEKRGLNLQGIYRISGDARAKKRLREQFEENSQKVDITNLTVDCHVITGILKDYLRKLPSPLINEDMCKLIKQEQAQDNSSASSQRKMLAQMMRKAPHTNRATLIFIMNHFQRVVEQVEHNKMTYKNLAVCFGPVMMCPPVAEMVDFQKYVDALEFLVTTWPTKTKQNLI